MGNSGCQSNSVTGAEIAIEAMSRDVSLRPSILQPSSALKLRNLDEDEHGEAVHLIQQPRLSFDSKAYQLEMRKRADSKSRYNQSSTNEGERGLNNCGSTSTIKPSDLQRSFEGSNGGQRPRANRSTHYKKNEVNGVQSIHQNSSMSQHSKLPVRIEEFLQKQVDFV